MGVVPLGIAFWQVVGGKSWLTPDVLFPAIFGTIFFIVGVVLFGYGTRQIVFDKNRGYFWKGRKDPDAVWNTAELKDFAELEDIYGLQIVSEWVKSDKSSYTSYELNLVLKDGSRLNVVDYGNAKGMREDSEGLAEFLGVAVLSK
jgi:hypothetical protein